MPRARTDNKAKPAAAPAEAATPPAPPNPAPTVEELRWKLVRKLSIFASDWRRCKRNVCRRQRQCTPDDNDFCNSPKRAGRPLTPEEESRAIAMLSRELARRRRAASSSS